VTVLQDGRAAIALQALAEVTDPASVGELVEVIEGEPGVRDLIFACRLPGYIGWRWTVSTAQVADALPTVLEVELLPGEGALVAPPWVPWAERLAEYRRTHPDEAESEEDLDIDDADDEADDEDEDDELEESDPDALEIDGVEFEIEDEDEDDADADAEDDEADDAAPRDEDAAWHDEGDSRS
jgi:hypothetical protein